MPERAGASGTTPESIHDGERAGLRFLERWRRLDRRTIPQRNAAFRDETNSSRRPVDLAIVRACPTLVISLHSPSQVTTMGWLDLDEYRQIESAARDRLGDLLRAAGPERRRAAAPLSALSTILYVSAALRAKPREIDRYIDYFGDSVLRPR